ncbi:MAG: NYN domain-containing protein [Candidatus Kapabacteria bacterium]|jgi:predicted RNA-binding protein with PIN domain|nr:NYN domain-containing protein [Candidatus Kapabacteria bacterium]
MKHFILDAHNIMHKSPVISDILDLDLLEARNALLYEIADYSDKYPSYKFSVVFDGRASKVSSPRSQIVVYKSGTMKIADTVIKDLIKKEIVPSLCTVVSSDSELYKYARIYSCTPILSEDFLSEISRFKHNNNIFESNTPFSEPNEKPEGINSDDYEDLLEAFNPAIKQKKLSDEQKKIADDHQRHKKKLKKYLEDDITIAETSEEANNREKPEDPSQKDVDEMKKLFGL